MGSSRLRLDKFRAMLRVLARKLLKVNPLNHRAIVDACQRRSATIAACLLRNDGMP